MPTLDWLGKRAVVNHHREVPYRLIHCDKTKSVGDPDAGNLLVQGDNLEALKALLPYYAGKVKCIYIDPPYNTGNEGWVYNDNVNSPEIKAWLGSVVGKEAEDLSRHDKWLCMMYPRLRLLKEFLRDDGVILISIDDFEVAHLREIMDEIFGRNNFIAQIVWEKSRKNDAKFISVGHEYICVYAKSLNYLKNIGTKWREKTEGMQLISKEYNRLKSIHSEDLNAIETGIRKFYSSIDKKHPSKAYSRYNKVDKDGVWRDDNMSWPGGGGPKYDVIHPVTGQVCAVPSGGWRYSTPEKMNLMIEKGVVVFRDDHTEPPIRKTRLLKAVDTESENDDEGLKVMTSYFFRSSLQASNVISSIFGKKAFDYPKDHEILASLIDYVSDDGDLIMDSFAGSGTTAQAVLSLNKSYGGNRKFLLIELDKDICSDITAIRIGKVISGYEYLDKKGEKISIEPLGGGFRYCNLGTPLFDEFGNISEGVTFQDLAAHVFFCETGSPIPKRAETGNPLIGTFQGRAIYLLYDGDNIGFANANAGNVLSLDILNNLEKLPEHSPVIYGEGSTLSTETLRENGATFKQIPYQIEGV